MLLSSQAARSCSRVGWFFGALKSLRTADANTINSRLSYTMGKRGGKKVWAALINYSILLGLENLLTWNRSSLAEAAVEVVVVVVGVRRARTTRTSLRKTRSSRRITMNWGLFLKKRRRHSGRRFAGICPAASALQDREGTS